MIRCETPRSLPETIQEMERRAANYADKVLAGKIPANRWLIAAVKRDQRDRKRQRPNGARGAIRFNAKAAFKVISFFGLLRHTKGRDFAGKVFDLSNWELWATYVLFGWERRNDDGNWVRRFNTAYIEVARKNGKSTWASAIGLYLLVMD